MSGIIPDIALAAGRGVEPPASSINPLGLAEQAAGLQARLNANQQFQNEFSARQRAGALIAASPTLDDAREALRADPHVMAFAPEALANTIGAKNAQLTGVNAQQGINRDALQAVVRASGAAIADPTKLDEAIGTAMAAQAPDVRNNPQVQQSIKNYRDAVMASNAPPGSAEWKHDVQTHMLGAVTAYGGDTSGLFQAAGGVAPQTTDLPNVDAATGQPTGGTHKGVIGGLPAASGGQPSPQDIPGTAGQTAAQQTYNTGKAQQALDFEGTLAQNNIKGLQTIRQIDDLQGELANFKAGGFSSQMGELSGVAQGLQRIGVPISNDTVNKLAGGDKAAFDAFKSNLSQFLASQVGVATSGQGKALLVEAEKIVDGLTVDSDPSALTAILNNARFAVQTNMQMKTQYDTYKRGLPAGSVPDVNQFQSDYAARFDPNSLPNARDSNSPIGPRGVKSVMGTEGAKIPNINEPADVGAALRAGKFGTGDAAKAKALQYLRDHFGAE